MLSNSVGEDSSESLGMQGVNPKGNQPWIFIGRTDAEAEAPIIWHLMWRANSLQKTLMLGRIEGRRRRGRQRLRWLDGIMPQWTWVWTNSGRSWRTGKPGVLQSMGSQRVGHKWVTELNYFFKLSDILCVCMLSQSVISTLCDSTVAH